MTRFDLALCLDLRQSAAEAARLGALIDALRARKATIGVLPVVSPTRPDRPWARALTDRLRTGAAALIDAGEPGRARLAAIDDVGAVLAPSAPAPRLHAARTIVRFGSDFAAAIDRLDPARLASNARDLAGGELAAAPADPDARRRLRSWAPLWPLTPWNWTWDWDREWGREWEPGARPEAFARDRRDDAAPTADLLADLLLDWPTGRPPPATTPETPPIAPARRRKRHVLFLSPNGVGLGHLTRLLAIARRLPRHIEPVFLTMSYGARVVEEFGFITEFTPRVADRGWWIEGVRATLNQMMAFYEIDAVVADLNVPYAGLLRARRDAPDVPFVWIRRGMWRDHHGLDLAERERSFDVVIEPGDFADDYDRGVTAARSDRVRRTAPIILLDDDELLDREAARRALDLPPDQTLGLLMLGSGVNFDMATVEERVVQRLQSAPGVDHRLLRWMNAAHPQADAAPERSAPRKGRRIADVPTVDPADARALSVFPAARYVRAFDFAVSAVGYNSFHELLHYRAPTVFVPNENPMMDDQEARAAFAERRGFAVTLKRSTLHKTDAVLAQMLDPAERGVFAARCADLPPPNGADAAAAILVELIDGVRSLHPLDGVFRR